ncbi:MAG TPA: type II/IV secretion system protein, partial [Candidatus Saccharimonadales bacterium]
NRCNGQGYIGRLGIYEILQITPKLQAAINDRSDNNTIQAIALEEGMKTMFVDGLIKVLRGDIDLQELLLVAYN